MTPNQLRFLRNLRAHTGARVQGVRPHVLEAQGLIERVGPSWVITKTGLLALHLWEVENGE